MKTSTLLLSSLVLMLSVFPTFFSFGNNFEYEYATALGWLFTAFLPPLALLSGDRLDQFFSKDADQLPSISKFAQLLRKIFTLSFLLGGLPLIALIPGTVSFYTNQCQCSENGFLLWMTVQALPNLYVALFCAALLHQFNDQGVAKLKLIGVYWSLVIFLIASVIGILWFAPQKRIVSFAFGYLHGPIYDSWIPIDWGVVISRTAFAFLGVMGVVFCKDQGALSIVDLFRIRSLKHRLAYKTLFLLIGLLWFSSLYAPSGGHGQKALKHLLAQKIEGQYVRLFFEKTNSSVNLAMAHLLKEADFHAKDLINIWGIKNIPRINIYVYPSADVKKIYFGGGSTDVTDVWTPSVHITLGQVPHQTLRHELVHAVSSFQAWHGLGFHPNMLLTEGLAVALAPSAEVGDIHAASLKIIKDQKIESMESLFTPLGFWSESGARAYTLAGSFLSFLTKRLGGKTVMAIYSGKSFEKASGQSLLYWIEEWKKFLNQFSKADESLELDQLFKVPGVLYDRCPHTKADYARPRDAGLSVRLRQPIGWDTGRYLEWRVHIDPSDQSSATALISQKIHEQNENKLLSPLAIETWLEHIGKRKSDSMKSIEDFEYALIQTDLLAMKGDIEASGAVLQLASDAGSFKNLPKYLLRQIIARQEVDLRLGKSSVGEWTEWRRFLGGYRSLPNKVDSDAWIFRYLKFRNLKVYKHEDVVGDAVKLFDDVPREFQIEWTKIHIARFIDLNDFSGAQTGFKKLIELTSGSEKEFYKIMLRFVQSK